MENNDVVVLVSERRRAWFRYFRSWRAVFWACGVTAAGASTLAAATQVSGEVAPYFAVLSSVCVAMLGFLDPQRRANAYVTAWRTLDSSLLRYKAGSCEISALIDSLDHGEAAIAEADAGIGPGTSHQRPTERSAAGPRQ